MMKLNFRISLAAVILFWGAVNSWANIWSVPNKDPYGDYYGTFGQLGINDDINHWGSFACGPVAAVNSFLYLQNKYGGLYDHKVIPDVNGDGQYDNTDLKAVALTLGGNQYMKTIADSQTYDQNFIYGKWDHLEGVAPGKTVYHAQMSDGWVGGSKVPGTADNTKPQWQFLYGQLIACEDVEVFMTWDTNAPGHYVTVTQFSWNDATSTGSMNYIDPRNGTIGTSVLSSNGGFVHADYFDGTDHHDASIQAIVAESPIPEPGTWILFGTGLTGAFGYLKRRPLRQG